MRRGKTANGPDGIEASRHLGTAAEVLLHLFGEAHFLRTIGACLLTNEAANDVDTNLQWTADSPSLGCRLS